MTETMYHGSDAEITTIDRTRDICLTDDRDIAAVYARRAGGGWVYEIELDDVALADEDDVRAAAARVAKRKPNGDVALLLASGAWVFELVDEVEVRDELTAAEFAGTTYGDATPDNETAHDTIRIWAAARVVAREEI